MKVLEPLVVLVVAMVVLVPAIPTVPKSPNQALYHSNGLSTWTAERVSGAKFLGAETPKTEASGSPGLVQKSKKKDLSKMKFDETEKRRIQKKALEAMSEEKRSEKEKEIRAERKRAEVKAQDQVKAFQKLAKKHESVSGDKMMKKEKKGLQKVKRHAGMMVQKEAMMSKHAKPVKIKREHEKHFKDAKMTKELHHEKHLKHKSHKHMKGKLEKELKDFNDDHFLKSAQPFMKEGNTLEERRALKALRLRVKSEAAEKHSKAATATRTKAAVPTAVEGLRLKALQKLLKDGAKSSASQAGTKAALKGNKFFEDRRKILEDEINGNDLGDLGSPDLENDISGFTPGNFETEEDIIEDKDVPSEFASIDDGSDLITPTSSVGLNEISKESDEVTGITYEEPSSSDNSASSVNSVDIVTLSSIDESESHNSEIREPISTGDDRLDLPGLPEIGDNSLNSAAGESNPNIGTDVTTVRIPTVTIGSEWVPDESPSSVPDEDNVPIEASSSVPAEASITVPGEASVPSEASNSVPDEASISVPDETSSSSPSEAPRIPWPWEETGEDAEPCGRARFGPETRLNRGSSLLKILEGKEALPGAFPWQVAILDSDRDLRCGGTLIAPRWVMTAAHCVQKRLRVRLSEHHIHHKEGYELEQKVRRVYVHPAYNSSTIDNDIALLRLPALPPIPSNSSRPPTAGVTARACLPRHGDHFPPVGTRCLVMGWGKASVNGVGGTDVLMYTRLPIISRKACQRANRKTITDNMFCAGHYKGGSDTCSGDSGGPLLCATGEGEEEWTTFGVTSFGDGCGAAGKMGVYARVNNYLPWIAGIMRRYLL